MFRLKQSRLNLHVVVLVIIGVSFIILLLNIFGFFYNIKQLSPFVSLNENKQGYQEFISKNMHFSVKVPIRYQIEERTTSTVFSDEKGKILVGRTGTNYSTIEQYLDNLSLKNNFKTDGKESIVINSLPTVVLNIDNRRDYFIYGTEWTVYTLSTDSEELYGDLDQVAQSFRYEP